MKRLIKKTKGVVKGAPSGFVISLMVHAAAFLLAGMLVVFTVHQKEEKKFVPPKPVERPKMKLKKPKVKVKKTAKPKSTTRIVTKVKRASMPDIQLPEMSGMTDGIVGGIGGFEIIPDLEQVTLFGGGQTIGNDFKGTFYDFKRDRRGSPVPTGREGFVQELKEFIRKGWKTSQLARYYRSPRKLYATAFAVPPVHSSLAPAAFGEEDTIGYLWAAHYKGQLVHYEDIKFRFWGLGDDIMAIRVDGKEVLIANYPSEDAQIFTSIWDSNDNDSRKYWLGDHYSVVGDWIELKAGEALPMEVLIGETPGGLFQAMLCVEVEGVEYPRNDMLNGPTLPIFKTETLSEDLVDKIHSDLYPGDATVTNGPVFRDYAPKQVANSAAGSSPLEPELEEVSESNNGMRIWTSSSGKTIEGKFVARVAGQALLSNSKGKQVKVPVEQLSSEDRTFIGLADPPDFDIKFSKTTEQVMPPAQSPLNAGERPYQMFDFIFEASVRKKGTSVYKYELSVDYYAFAEEVDGDNYKLVDHQASSFVPSPENKETHSFSGEEVRIGQVAVRASAPLRGTKYGGFLVTLTDERGRIIQHKTSHEWLFEDLDKLIKIPVGKHFDKELNRVGPPRPGPADRPDWF
ncbi:hypothetical protein PDESU_02610 [Pontiella desulfatans]|uniref:SLA1 homology domain-containing protein n=1 Tax=Pontiella desulfatans TaxID=2750659 RepID=A0A6C2U2C5_PONDE|nr:SHD1 domain-containing protein [Pontiella desulfatans]VGO14053.1 hypothetical protein PDESU_02610 [Pontiella desulfatans]